MDLSFKLDILTEVSQNAEKIFALAGKGYSKPTLFIEEEKKVNNLKGLKPKRKFVKCLCSEKVENQFYERNDHALYIYLCS